MPGVPKSGQLHRKSICILNRAFESTPLLTLPYSCGRTLNATSAPKSSEGGVAPAVKQTDWHTPFSSTASLITTRIILWSKTVREAEIISMQPGVRLLASQYASNWPIWLDRMRLIGIDLRCSWLIEWMTESIVNVAVEPGSCCMVGLLHSYVLTRCFKWRAACAPNKYVKYRCRTSHLLPLALLLLWLSLMINASCGSSFLPVKHVVLVVKWDHGGVSF